MNELKFTKNKIEIRNPAKRIFFSLKNYNTDKILKTKLLIKNLAVFFQRNNNFYKDMFNIHSQAQIKNLQLSSLLSEEQTLDKEAKKIIVFICSNKGLCKKYNDNIYNEIINIIKTNKDKKYILIPIGKKASIFSKSLQEHNIEICDLELYLDINDLDIDKISVFTNVLWNIIIKNYNVTLDIVYSHTSSNKKKKILVKKLFPVIKQIDIENFIQRYEAEEVTTFRNIVTDTENDDNILENLLKNYLQYSLYKCLLYALYSEYVCRADSIENLYNNIVVKTSNLYRHYNKLQNKIQVKNVLEAISIYKKI